MYTASAVGPTWAELQPGQSGQKKSSSKPRFPIHADLTDTLVEHQGATPHPVIAHTLSVCASYTYATVAGFGDSPTTLARMMARQGLPSANVLMVADRVDTSFIVSNAKLVQSQDGRVAILSYRGTEPFNLANWLTDIDMRSESVNLHVGGTDFLVHQGFYRNVRATRSPLIRALQDACAGKSIIAPTEPMPNKLEALYITGHSLGGAMAVLLALLLLNDPQYTQICRHLRHVYTFGQPMVGPPALSTQIQQLGQDKHFSRFVYERDVIARLPPWGMGEFRHFGAQFQPSRNASEMWRETEPASPAPLFLVPLAPVEFVARQLPFLRRAHFPYSLSDHLPLNYMQWLAPPGLTSEYGDYAGSVPTESG